MKEKIYLLASIIMFTIAGFTAGITSQNIFKIIPENKALTSTMSQESTSMLPTLQPDMEIESIPFNGTPKCGHLYIYEKDGQRILHRNVYEDDKQQYWFKGDNNKYYDEPIKSNQIIEEVIGIKI